jgi:hypothetical protein
MIFVLLCFGIYISLKPELYELPLGMVIISARPSFPSERIPVAPKACILTLWFFYLIFPQILI